MITPQLYALFLCHRNTANPKQNVIIPSTHASTPQTKRATGTFLNPDYALISLTHQFAQQQAKDIPFTIEMDYFNNTQNINPNLPQPTVIAKPSISISS